MKSRPEDKASGPFSLSQRLRIILIAALGTLLVRLIGITLRFRESNRKVYDEIHERGQPVILSFWHNQIFYATYYWRRRGIVVITSRHFDGEYIARIIERFGYGTSRGSCTRGAVGALLGLRRRLKEGRDVAFTIDGPRGPRYEVKPGPVWLARKTGCPIVCFHLEPSRYWELKSWDKLRIPKPFSEVTVRIGEPLYAAPNADESAEVEAYQREMDRIRKLAEGSL